MASMIDLIVSTLWKWRALSSMKPRQAKRGASSMLTAGSWAGPLAASCTASCQTLTAP
jgi:hypothetical protein